MAKDVRYISNRFLDKLAPGDEVPADAYDADHLARMVASGQITAEEIENAPKPAAKKAAKKAS